MTRLLVPIVAFALGLGGALGLAACGEDEEGLLPGNTAEDILSNLETVEQRAAEEDCSGAAAAADQVASQIEELGPGVSERLKRALEEGAARLQEVVDTCEEEVPVAPPEPDTTEVPTEETTDTVDTDEDGEEPDEDDEETTAPEPTEPPDTTPTTPTTPTPPLPPPTDGDDDVSGGGEGSGSGGIGPGRVTEDD